MAGNERQVETYLHDKVKALGGTTRKWVSPGRAGVPDRIVIFPGGHIVFVEVKTITGKLSVRQTRELAELKSIGCDCHVVYGKNGVDELMQTLTRRYIFA